MVLGVVASDGKMMPPFFFKLKEKVGADVYYKVLRYHVLPWPKANYERATMCGPRMVLPAIQPERCRSSAKLPLLISGHPPAWT